ncbi:uncharacterized protein [Halyomorpha halys]|uniref:uncharacterized protein n=1 Tax=Halyomorpha halys TaxID=286706 RepID=UPI0006D5222B|nr:uncharacterized protein LOC106687186 [Halyomorpha halys]
MKVVLFLFFMVVGCTFGEEVPTDKNGESLHREKKDIAKLEALFGLKSRPFYGGYQEPRPVYAPLCNCWRPTTRPYVSEDTVVVYPPQPQLRPVALPAQPALIAPSRIQPAQPAYPINTQAVLPAAPAIFTGDQPQPCPPGYNYDRPSRPFNK